MIQFLCNVLCSVDQIYIVIYFPAVWREDWGNDEKKLEVEGPVRDDGGLAWAGSGGDGQDHETFFRLVL